MVTVGWGVLEEDPRARMQQRHLGHLAHRESKAKMAVCFAAQEQRQECLFYEGMP